MARLTCRYKRNGVVGLGVHKPSSCFDEHYLLVPVEPVFVACVMIGIGSPLHPYRQVKLR